MRRLVEIVVGGEKRVAERIVLEMDVIDLEPVEPRRVRRFLKGPSEADRKDCWNGCQATRDVLDEFEARGLVVGAAETDVGDGDFGFEVLVGEERSDFPPVVDCDLGGLCRVEVAERGETRIFGGGAAVILVILSEGWTEEFRERWHVCLAEHGPEIGGGDATEIAEITRFDAVVFPFGSVADAFGWAEVDASADFERAAALMEEVTSEAATEDGADLATGFWFDAGDADEAGLHAGQMCDY
jgi:hypothetical protein